jgi:hypothetical protein
LHPNSDPAGRPTPSGNALIFVRNIPDSETTTRAGGRSGLKHARDRF